MEYREFTAKTVADAITEACEQLEVTSDRLDYEVINEGSAGFLGFNAKKAVIKARVKEAVAEVSEEKKEAPVQKEEKAPENKAVDAAKEETTEGKEKKNPEKKSNKTPIDGDEKIDQANEFLKDVFAAMNMEVKVDAKFEAEDNILSIDLAGNDMGVLIGKRGQTLDSLQYLISLVVNKNASEYIHVKVDTENYRARRKATLENLAKNIAYKVKRTHQSVALEPMNPYERRIIHSALQNDKYVTTHSEGEEPYRRVVVTLKK